MQYVQYRYHRTYYCSILSLVKMFISYMLPCILYMYLSYIIHIYNYCLMINLCNEFACYRGQCGDSVRYPDSLDMVAYWLTTFLRLSLWQTDRLPLLLPNCSLFVRMISCSVCNACVMQFLSEQSH